MKWVLAQRDRWLKQAAAVGITFVAVWLFSLVMGLVVMRSEPTGSGDIFILPVALTTIWLQMYGIAMFDWHMKQGVAMSTTRRTQIFRSILWNETMWLFILAVYGVFFLLQLLVTHFVPGLGTENVSPAMGWLLMAGNLVLNPIVDLFSGGFTSLLRRKGLKWMLGIFLVVNVAMTVVLSLVTALGGGLPQILLVSGVLLVVVVVWFISQMRYWQV